MAKWGEDLPEDQKPQSGGGKYGKLEDGDNKLRIVSGLAHIAYHFDPVAKRSVPCTSSKLGPCPICKEIDPKTGKPKNRPNHRYLVNCIDLNQVKTMEDFSNPEKITARHYEFPYTVVDAIQGFALDPDYKFDDIPDWDMTVTRKKTGSRPTDVEYQVRPARKSRELTDAEKEAMKELEDPEDIVAQKMASAMEADPGYTPDEAEEEEKDIDEIAEEVDLNEAPF